MASSHTLGQEARRLAELAWPVVLAQLGHMGLGLVDVWMVGKLGEEALGGVALGNSWSFAATIVLLGTIVGMDPLFAQAFGAGDPHAAGRALVRGGVVASVVAVPVFGFHLVAGAALGLLGQPVELLPLAGSYAAVVGLALPFLMVFALLRRFVQGEGRMKGPAIAIGVGNLVNVPADYALIHGAWGAPELGAVGAAWATVLVRVAMVVAMVAMAWPSLKRAWPGLAGVVRLRAIGEVLSHTLPVGVQSGMEVWSFNAALLMMGWLGKTEVAAHTVAMQFVALSFMVPLGIASAASTRVGNLLGAGAPWRLAGWTAIAMGTGVMAVSASFFFTFPEPLARVFTQDAPVVAVAVTLLPLAGAFQLFDGMQVVAFGVLRGAGDTRVPALANLVGYWLFGLPLGYVLAFRLGWGARGIWLGLAAALAMVSVLLLLRLRTTMRRGGFRLVA